RGLPSDGETADDVILPQQGNAKDGLKSVSRKEASQAGLVDAFFDIGNGDRLAGYRRLSHRPFAQSKGIRPERLDEPLVHPMRGAHNELFALLVVFIDRSSIRP